MFDFEFEYKDRRSVSITGINEVVYYTAGFNTVVQGQEILRACLKTFDKK